MPEDRRRLRHNDSSGPLTESSLQHPEPVPRNMGELPCPDGIGCARIECGDAMRIALRVEQDRIVEARFMTDGCGIVMACGSAVTELARGLGAGEAMLLSEDDITRVLGCLPAGEEHAATLAVNALKQALADYYALKREPWKKPYRQVPRI